ncbi:MAG TPA: hypothetical protein DHU55_15710 [Blastocatellia bacterium]|jgi:DNA-binding NtrC family response regulator|nr:hypothetical protein [Blastocatellia bacterium]HAF25488.1 hypothetical protein [Blastocatellia bacterium]HCX31191.1 hypothetical protein [Blastocatellia bacterium]
MRAERAIAIEPGKNRRAEKSSTARATLQLRIAGRPGADRVQNLIDLADTLLREAEALARDKQFADQSNRLRAFDIAEGIDFYRELERFETNLIKLALKQTRGHQTRAATLLHLNPTTLHSKIKLYGIKY